MTVYLNGRFLLEEQACVSIHDRGFLYGDGLFETIRVYEGEPFLWEEHMARLETGCKVLRIAPPFSAGEMRVVVRELLRRNSLREAIVRIALSRGIGPRGYSPRGAEHPTLCVAPFEAPKEVAEAYRLISASLRLPAQDPLSSFKHGNKLRQVLARAEADDAGANEALMLNERGEVVEGTTTNIFWIEKGRVCTPPLGAILAGTTRAHVLRLCAALGIASREKSTTLKKLVKADGVFVTSSGNGIVEVSEIDGVKFKRSAIVRQLQRNYRRST